MDNFDVNRFVAEGIEDEGWTVESFGICPIVNMIWNWFKKMAFFCKCTNLKSITLPKKLEYIGKYCF